LKAEGAKPYISITVKPKNGNRRKKARICASNGLKTAKLRASFRQMSPAL
jgi:hypothetical protein